jgi:hypothetical protein
MNMERQIGLGIGLGVVLPAMFEFVPNGDICILVSLGLVTLVGLIGGERLPVFIRVFFTVLIFYFGAEMALVGRTFAPGLTTYTFGMALSHFVLIGIWPVLSLLRLWTGGLRVALVVAVLPVSLALAFAVAGMEEFIFVQKHKVSGAGPTARWTIGSHWMSYDAKTGRLNGSD